MQNVRTNGLSTETTFQHAGKISYRLSSPGGLINLHAGSERSRTVNLFEDPPIGESGFCASASPFRNLVRRILQANLNVIPMD
jgi:hypothetical protein